VGRGKDLAMPVVVQYGEGVIYVLPGPAFELVKGFQGWKPWVVPEHGVQINLDFVATSSGRFTGPLYCFSLSTVGDTSNSPAWRPGFARILTSLSERLRSESGEQRIPAGADLLR